ncbi:MAG: DUF2892 domain-containing protein [Bdellovibrionales bacterium]
MKCNLAVWDRSLRFLLAVLLLSYAIAGGPLWAWSGLYLLLTASWGLCPLYSFLKIKTIRTPRYRV